MSLLKTDNLSIGYKNGSDKKALQHSLNLKLNEGEIISLLGQNGVGKTTFLKTISGLHIPLEGSVYLNGDPLPALSNKDISQRMSIVLTEKPSSYNLSVLELIAIGRHPYSNWLGILNKKDKDIIEWAFNETHINYLADKKLYELSDGQLQKVMIARALAQETDLIVLDEPTAHLDLYNKIEVMTLLRQISKNGKGILISTHDLQISTQLSDQLWLFNFNEPVQTGIPEDLILTGALEKTLYLTGYGYDMIHGTVDLTVSDKNVRITGEAKRKFWTAQALKRNGYNNVDTSKLAVNCVEQGWVIHGDFFYSLKEVMDKIHSLES